MGVEVAGCDGRFGEQTGPTHVLGEAGLGGPLCGEQELVHWSAHYGTAGTVLRAIHCMAVELITPSSHGAPGTQRQQGSLQR
ncbi:hypothetical protein CgunFtcFv8_017576 [Champsocephalus gunnari]|uniref:Uncharacterized protein n=1 Tax=Champsocephalus gunnari TaxID=52237 RepID=A0AAN8HV25_CHAGU|nr:hypothetical protein CgunFtcFv8_017576 [Champsocephalus gunnari]